MRAMLPPRTELDRITIHRDSSYDQLLFVGTKTTSVFCRPSCPARVPHLDNVEYFVTAAQALHAGYRPCLRCRPLEAGNHLPVWAKRLVSQLEADPTASLDEGALRRRGLEPARVRRVFERSFGMSFQAFRRLHRLGFALNALGRGADATGVAFDAGFESVSGFRDAFARTFGRPPGRGQEIEAVKITWVPSPLGAIIASANDDGVCSCDFVDRLDAGAQIENLRRRLRAPLLPGQNRWLDRLAGELAEYFVGSRRQFTVPVCYRDGTAFQRIVWGEVERIPYGETRSYRQVARSIGAPGAQRAVGRANGLNLIAIIVPCHRVVRSDGAPGGYAGGMWRKSKLIALERGHRPDMPARRNLDSSSSLSVQTDTDEATP